MVSEINSKSSPSEQVSPYWWDAIKFWRVMTRHEELFPASQLRRSVVVAGIYVMLALFAAFWLGVMSQG